MIKKLILVAIVLFGLAARSQTVFPSPYVVENIDWIKYYSQRDGVSSAPTALDVNSCIYLGGYSGLTSAADLVVLKYDSTGTLAYSYSYNNGGYDEALAIKVKGAIAYVAGVSAGTTTNNDYFIVKLTATGSVAWTKRWDGSFSRIDQANAICVDGSGNVYVTGKSQNSSGTNYDIVTLKLNGSTGATIWSHTFNGASNKDDIGIGIVLSSNSSIVYIAGSTVNSSNNSDIVVYALNTGTGLYQWASPVITNGSAGSNDKPSGIILSGKNIVVCGEVNRTSSGLDYYTAKYNGLTGATMWGKYYDVSSATNRATALCRDSTGNIGVVGTLLNGSIYEYHSVFYDSTGVQYATNIESTGLSSLMVDPTLANDTIAHHWYCAGERQNATRDIFVYQIVPSGNTSWKQSVDGQTSDIDAATGVAVNGVGVVYVGAQSKNSAANYDYTAVKLDQTPLYWPPDYANEPVNKDHLYLKNLGQLVKNTMAPATEALYYTQNSNPQVFIEQNAFDFVFSRIDTVVSSLDTLEKIQCKFVNPNSLAILHDYLPMSTKYNYYLGYAPVTSVPNVQGNQRIFVPNFFPYVDLHYFSYAGGIKYYLVVKPGANLREVKLQIGGASSTAIDGTTGRLTLNGNLGTVELNKPIAYTVNMSGAVVAIAGSAIWVNAGTNLYSITPPAYTASQPLIIEVSKYYSTAKTSGIAANLDYSTYYGGSANDVFNDIVAAKNGDRYVAGTTYSGVFPAQNASNTYQGYSDAVALKYTADDTLRYATFQGGKLQDMGATIAVDSQGNAFIGGQTFSIDMPVLNVSGATNQSANGGLNSSLKADGWISKLTGNSNTLSWMRYVGGSAGEDLRSLFIDSLDNLYLAGQTSSSDFPVMNAFKSTLVASPSNPTNQDAFFGKFNSSLVAQWITYYGGSTNGVSGSAQMDMANDIVVDKSGHVIGCGITDANNLPTVNSTGNTNTFYASTIGGAAGYQDGFLVRYSSSGTPDFSSYFGGSNDENINRLVYKSNLDQIFFAGDGFKGTGFPFVSKLGATNSQYCNSSSARTAFLGYMSGDLTKQWCSYYGKGQVFGADYFANGLSVDNSGLMYLSGFTSSDTLQKPTTTPPGVYVDNVRQGKDGFIAIYTPAKVLYHAHYFGGVSSDQINNSDIALNSKLYVAGQTSSNNFPIAYTPITAALIDSTYNLGGDGTISRFGLAIYQVTGIQQVAFDKVGLRVYPNPANTQFIIELSDELTSKATVCIYSLMGQMIYKSSISDKSMQINCESWTNGVYLIKVSNNEAQTTFKLIKE